jgi:hypothetical protein
MFCRHTKRNCCMKTFATTRVLLVALLLIGFVDLCGAQSFEDFFTNRQTFTTASGVLEGSNSNATVEPGEPLHAGKTGGHSLWISWVAPSNGVARFKTETSGFDTLLAAYNFSSTNDTTFDKLIVAARNDDSEELNDRESTIEFGVRAGQRFEIAVDGYFGAVGSIKMQWSLDVTPNPPPTIVSTTPNTTLKIGDPITLEVVLTNVPGGTKYKWFFNGAELGDEKNTTLVISSMQVTNVGRYKLQIDVGSHITYFAFSTELQINTEGANALAQGKLPDAPGTELVGSDGNPFRGLSLKSLAIAAVNEFGVVRGYNGSQIFNTTFATTDPAEPTHCSVTGGYSYWLSYQPPANGRITLDTSGSSYDTVMEVYSYNVPPTTYNVLISVACDHGSVPGAARIQLPVVKTRQYVVAIAGVNGAKGTAYLNYSLNTNQLPQAPHLTREPQTVTATAGANVLLAPPVTGSPPLHFHWAKNSFPVTNSYAPTLLFPNVAPNETGDYLVTVTNDLGTVAATLPLHVVTPPNCTFVSTSSNTMLLSIQTQIGMHYFVEEALDLRGPWLGSTNFYVGDGKSLTVLMQMDQGREFYRVRVE